MKTLRLTLVALASAAVLAACSADTGTPAAVDTSSSLSTTPAEATPSTSQTTTIQAQISTANIPNVGTVLVEQNGRTLYMFMNDTGTKPTCTGACSANWPGLITTGPPQASGGADDSKLGTTKSPEGGQQVTYNGHPLYLYTGDKAQGDANGQGIGGVWFAVTPDGNPAGQGDDNGGGNSGQG
jgi:predicted lipoprotein with Yx(FWY)xxD motif